MAILIFREQKKSSTITKNNSQDLNLWFIKEDNELVPGTMILNQVDSHLFFIRGLTTIVIEYFQWKMDCGWLMEHAQKIISRISKKNPLTCYHYYEDTERLTHCPQDGNLEQDIIMAGSLKSSEKKRKIATGPNQDITDRPDFCLNGFWVNKELMMMYSKTFAKYFEKQPDQMIIPIGHITDDNFKISLLQLHGRDGWLSPITAKTVLPLLAISDMMGTKSTKSDCETWLSRNLKQIKGASVGKLLLAADKYKLQKLYGPLACWPANRKAAIQKMNVWKKLSSDFKREILQTQPTKKRKK